MNSYKVSSYSGDSVTTPLRFPNTPLIIMRRDGAIIFGDLIGKLDTVRVT